MVVYLCPGWSGVHAGEREFKRDPLLAPGGFLISHGMCPECRKATESVVDELEEFSETGKQP